MGKELMTQIADGSYSAKYNRPQPMGKAAGDDLNGYNRHWATANEWICNEQVLVC